MARASQPMKSSRFHSQVSKTLHFLNIPHKNESIVGGVSVDILVETGGEKTVIEVNGPSHYLNVAHSTSSRMKGEDHFKQQILETRH